MRQPYKQCLLWLALAAVTVVALDTRPAMSMEGPAFTPFAGASTAAFDTSSLDTVLGATRADGLPIELVPAEGYPLTYSERDSIVRLALSFVGVQYQLGGTSPDRGFDCSGFVGYVLSQLDLPVPRLAYQQGRVGMEVEPRLLQAGDLLTFGRDSISHVGIYIGGGRFVHASSVAKRVTVSRLDRPATGLVRPFHGARRLFIAATSTRAGA